MDRIERLTRAIEGLQYCRRVGLCEGCPLAEPVGEAWKHQTECRMDDAVELLKEYRRKTVARLGE